MSDYGGFPMSVIVTGFFVTSLAYLICFCCCIIQFFIRRNRTLAQTHGQNIFGQNIHLQKNDTLKRKLLRNFTDSLKRFKKSRGSLPPSFVQQEGLPTSCPICFEEYTENVEEIFIGFIKPCKHFYHFDCIWQWLENRGNCPLCREKVKLKEDDIKGISLRNLPKYLKDKGITVSKEDHVVINIKSDSDFSVCGETTQSETRNEDLPTSHTNAETSCSNGTETGHIATVEVENKHGTASMSSSENNTLDSQKSSGSSEVYVKNTQASVHSSHLERDTSEPSTAHADQGIDFVNCDVPSSSAGADDHVIATRIEIRSNQGVDNIAFQNSQTDPV